MVAVGARHKTRAYYVKIQISGFKNFVKTFTNKTKNHKNEMLYLVRFMQPYLSYPFGKVPTNTRIGKL